MKVFTAWFTMLLLSFLLLPVIGLAAAQPIQLFMNGKQLVPEVAPRIVNDNTIVPIRIIAESLGSKVSWDPKLRKVSVAKEGTSIQLFIDKKQATVDGKSYTLETAPTIIEGNTMLPIRFVSENLGVEVTWDEPTRSVFLYHKQKESPEPDQTGSEDGKVKEEQGKPGNDAAAAGNNSAGNNNSAGGKNPQESKDKTGDKEASSGGSGNPVKAGEQPVNPGANAPSPGCAVPQSATRSLAPGAADANAPAVKDGKAPVKVQSITFDGEMLCIQTTGGEVKPTMFKLAEPDRIVLDIPGAELDATLATVVNEAKEGTVPLTEPHDIVAKIRYSLFSKEPSTVRIVIDLQKKSELILSDVLPGGLISAKLAKGKDRYRVVIDPGHGGKDSGAVSVTNRFEKDLVLSLGHKVADLLQKEPGIEAVMTRSDDTFIELADRVAKAEESEADLFISIHANTINKESVGGTETFYWTPQSMDFANLMHKSIVEATGFTDRKVKQERFYVIRNTTMPSVLLEIGFLSNPAEEALMYQDAFQNRVAESIVAAIKKQLNLD
ncbi:hypothetical protein PN4B1_03230 [Paenibacillus naphthalenovorans]|uniref:N-acetylmuramoyl-L-alanine amidase n=2 Tax=Paenibacillus naphthalenovorans TaxID=162209 RepID=A0A0U2KZT2_9BACL|nr:N-acetylmuramoyl-L-alanine amidase [Paenibacillus naphthalenovorans]GCL70422.1 hypothetical protein PN4B1_03230 [Paenibacillus naphthalenovorans]